MEGGSVYVPITPCRVADTRSTTPLTPGATRQFQVGGSTACPIPDGVTAVEASITAVGASANGFFRAWPNGVTPPNATFLNYTRAQNTTNTGAIALAPTGIQDLAVANFGATTNFVIDIQGYFADPATTEGGSVYVPITPCRVADTRVDAPLRPGESLLTQVSGSGFLFAEQGGRNNGCGIPDGVTAVESSVTAATPSANGFFRAWPTGVTAPNATFLNYTRAQNTTNTGAIALAPTGIQDLTIGGFASNTHHIIDIQGYYSTGATPPTVLDGVGQLDAGGASTCAVLDDDTVQCWGAGQHVTAASSLAVSAIKVPGLSGVTKVAVGDDHACALTTGGTVRCWGDNSSGQLGNGSTSPATAPVTVSGLSGVIDLTVGGSHSCAVLSGGTARCWGTNNAGQLGNGIANPTATSRSATPVNVTGLTGATSIAASSSSPFGDHTCAVRSDTTVRCWGGNLAGQLGNNSTTRSSTPVTVSGLSGVTGLSLGFGTSCASRATGAVSCWGDGTFGQLGNGSFETNSSVPVNVTGLTDASAVAAGGVLRDPLFGAHSCALRSNGTVRCWGLNLEGALGDGSTDDAAAPVDVTGLTGAIQVVAGGAHSCALLGDDTVRCWGSNFLSQIGDGSTDNPVTTGVAVRV